MVLDHLGAGLGGEHVDGPASQVVGSVVDVELEASADVGLNVETLSLLVVHGDGGADLIRLGVVVDEGEDGLVSLLPDAARAAAVLTQLTSMIGDGDGGEMLVVGWTGGARSR